MLQGRLCPHSIAIFLWDTQLGLCLRLLRAFMSETRLESRIAYSVKNIFLHWEGLVVAV